MAGKLRIGVLALQGNFREHVATLRALDADAVEIRQPEQLAGLDGLVIPGGESTAIGRLVELYGFDEALRAFEAPVFGTCAGMILVAAFHPELTDDTRVHERFLNMVREELGVRA